MPAVIYLSSKELYEREKEGEEDREGEEEGEGEREKREIERCLLSSISQSRSCMCFLKNCFLIFFWPHLALHSGYFWWFSANLMGYPGWNLGGQNSLLAQVPDICALKYSTTPCNNITSAFIKILDLDEIKKDVRPLSVCFRAENGIRSVYFPIFFLFYIFEPQGVGGESWG